MLVRERADFELHKTYNLRYFNRRVLNYSGETPIREIQKVSPSYKNRAIRRDDLGTGLDIYV